MHGFKQIIYAAPLIFFAYGASAAEEPVSFPPKISLADGNFTMKLNGFAQWDGALIDNDAFDYDNGGMMRRARLKLSGTSLKDFSYEYETEFTGPRISITDMFIAYNGIKNVKLQAGQFKEPFSLEVLNSDQSLVFLERPAIENFAPARNLGAAVRFWGENWTFAGGAFGEDVNSNNRWDEDYSITSRATYAPILEKDRLLHFGIAGSYRTPDSAETTRFDTRPEIRITDHKIISTGNITEVDHTLLLGLEAAGAYGPFSLRGEYNLADVNRDSLPDVTFDGWYAMASYFLTGENYEYKAADGIFGKANIAHPVSFSGDSGWGAWEVAGRISNLNLNDGPITGGEMTTYTLALNWHLNDNLRLMLDHTWVDTDAEASPANDQPRILALRAQLRF